MRVLLAQNLVHLPSHGGANRSNRLLMEQLAARGHECAVVAPLTGALGTVGDPVAAVLERGAAIVADRTDTLVYRYAGVTVHAVRAAHRLPATIKSVAAALRPDHTVVPSDDPGHVVLGAVTAATPDRIVHIVHTLQQLPYGPGAFYPSAAGTRMLGRVRGTVAVSRAAREYVRAYGGIDATVLHPPVYGPGPYPVLGRFGGDVTMVNPCGYKGLPILLALADAYPQRSFRAVPTWGTLAGDRAALASRPNIRIVPPDDDIDRVLAGTGVLLMPSLWDETFGYTCVEAMLRGIPVLASAVAGLVEAKLGTDGTIPVRPVTRYRVDERPDRPVPEIPVQDLRPWLAALERWYADPVAYRDAARHARAAAGAFVAELDEGAFEAYLTGLPDNRGEVPFDRAAALRQLAARRAAPPGAATAITTATATGPRGATR